MRALLTLPLLLLLTGCPGGQRCSPEEAAYVEEVRPFLVSTGLELPECTIDPRTRSVLFQQAGAWNPRLVNLEASAAQLSTIAPPVAFHALHTDLVHLVGLQARLEATVARKRAVAGQFWRWIGRAEEKTQLLAALGRDSLSLQTERDKGVIDTRAAVSMVNADIRARPPAPVYAASETRLLFRPKGSQVELGMGQSGFSVDIAPQVETPIGDFSMGVTRGTGVRRLVISSGGRQRIFKIDRPFRLFVPSSYGFEIVSETQDVLVINVRDRA